MVETFRSMLFNWYYESLLPNKIDRIPIYSSRGGLHNGQIQGHYVEKLCMVYVRKTNIAAIGQTIKTI